MGLYNMLFGVNPLADELLAVLGYTRDDIPRFRDCFLNNGRIVIHTRTGGGNRDYYENLETCKSNYPEYFGKGSDPSGPWNDDLRQHPMFIVDGDLKTDSTYANFFYGMPVEYADKYESAPNALMPDQQWEQVFETLGIKK